jgi:subtilase family serine protease
VLFSRSSVGFLYVGSTFAFTVLCTWKENYFMKKLFFLRGFACMALIVAILALAGTAQAAPRISAQSQSTRHFDMRKLVGVRPLWQYAQKVSTNGVKAAAATTASIPPCITNPTPTPETPTCYGPQQIRTAYDVNSLLKAGVTGKGQTIVVVDSSSSPTLQSDVHLYDQLYGLKDPKLNVIAPFGNPPFDPNVYPETALDVETVHSLAPDATIDLVLTGDTTNDLTIESFFVDLLKPVQYAIQHNLGSAISISYGAGESCFDSAYFKSEHAIFKAAQARHISVFVSAGDSGASNIACTSPTTTTGLFEGKGTSIPASDPLVTSVGGTSLYANVKTGQYKSETTWNEDAFGDGATGGGISTVFPRPDYQNGIKAVGNKRGVPDVAWDGDPVTGVPIVFSDTTATYIVPVGGTSVGAPAWAGLTALFDQVAGKHLGFLNDGIYRILKSGVYSSAFHDITTGNNSVTGFDLNGNPVAIQGYNAGKGWDAVTGAGTPKATALALLLPAFVRSSDGSNL